LDQVVVLGATAFVPVCEALDERQVELDQPLARARVTAVAIRHQKAGGGTVANAPGLGC
jgi:hypothetical protein